MNAVPQPPSQPLARRLLGAPGTRAGWGAVALVGLHILLMLLWQSHLLTRISPHSGTGFFADPLHAAPILLAEATAVAAGLLSLFAIIWRGERSIILGGIVLYALLVAAFALGEVVAPH